MATFGKMKEFEPETERIASYLEQIEIFFLANEIANDKKVPVFLSVVGAKTYSLLRDLLAPSKPQEKTMNELTQTLKRHFEPKPLVIAERFHFHRRNQIATESVSEYVAQLRGLATHCEFGEFLNDALRDGLVCGLNNTSAQKRLLSEATLTLAKAVEIVQSKEAAEKSSKVFHEGEGGAVGQLNTQRSSGSRLNDSLPPGKPSCHRCGGSNHSPDSCRFKMAICHKCKKRGHLARMCRRVSVNPSKKTFRT